MSLMFGICGGIVLAGLWKIYKEFFNLIL